MPAVVALVLLFVLVVRGRRVEFGLVVGVLVLSEAWRRVRLRPRAGQARRAWPWQDD